MGSWLRPAASPLQSTMGHSLFHPQRLGGATRDGILDVLPPPVRHAAGAQGEFPSPVHLEDLRRERFADAQPGAPGTVNDDLHFGFLPGDAEWHSSTIIRL